MALKCCNKLCQLIETVTLYDTETQRHRVLVIGRCKNPKCGSLKGEFVFWDTRQEKFIYQRIPKKKLNEVITKFKKSPYLVYHKENVRYGTMSNMSWTYQKNGCVYDFNETLIAHIKTDCTITQGA